MKFQIFTVTFLFTIIVAAISIIPSSYAQTHTDYNEQLSSLYQNNMWHLGKNLAPGDSYTYKICDPMAIINYSAESYHYFVQGNDDHNNSLCYMIKLDFVSLLSSDENDIDSNIWVVQTTIQDFVGDDKDTIRRSVFHIDSENFAVKSADTIHPDTLRYANSLEDTIFSLYKYADEPKLLKTGAKWGQITEALYETGTNPYMTVRNDTIEFSVTQTKFNNSDEIFVPTQRTFSDVSEVGYETDILDEKNANKDIKDDDNNVVSSYLVSSEIPFPLSATVYSPVHVIKPFKQYEFELLSLFTDEKITTSSSENDIPSDTSNNENIENDNIDEDVNVTNNVTSNNITDIVDNIKDTTMSDEINNDDDSIDDIIIDESDTNNNQENVIKEDIISDNTDNDGSIIYDNDNENTENDDDSFNSSIAVFVLLIVIIGIVFYFRKFRNKDHDNIINKTIYFKDNVAIRIKDYSDVEKSKKSSTKEE